MTEYKLTIEHSPHEADVSIIRRGLSAYNVEQVGDDAFYEYAIFLKDDHARINGGAFAELMWGWVGILSLWVARDLRGQGHGGRLLAALEHEAVIRGYTHSFLIAGSFQSAAFFIENGYGVFGKLENYPPGHKLYWLKKENLIEQPHGFAIITNPSEEQLAILRRGVRDYERSQRVYVQPNDFAVFIRDKTLHIHGGAAGSLMGGWFYLSVLWIEEALRGQGYGTNVLALMEQEALRYGITRAFTDTTDFQALEFYQRNGYEVFAQIDNRPAGHVSYMLKKENL